MSNQDFQKTTKRYKSYAKTATDSQGASGGIGTLWNKIKWDLISENSTYWWVRTDFKNKTTKEEFIVFNIYARNHYRDKAHSWNSINSELQTCQNRNKILGGDLNLIRNIEEKIGGKYLVDPSRYALEEIIETHKLIDIPPCNGKFTWSNKRAGTHNIKERLDRILIHEGIAASFSSIKSKLVHATASDHKPVVLILDRIGNLNPIPFKYNKAWDSKEDFHKIIKESWDMEIFGSPHYVCESKLKSARSAIKK